MVTVPGLAPAAIVPLPKALSAPAMKTAPLIAKPLIQLIPPDQLVLLPEKVSVPVFMTIALAPEIFPLKALLVPFIVSAALRRRAPEPLMEAMVSAAPTV